MTRLCGSALAYHGIAFTDHSGQCVIQGEGQRHVIRPHFWLELADDENQGTWTVDYRLRCYVQTIDVAHGVFQANQWAHIRYESDHPVELGLLPPFLIRDLQIGWSKDNAITSWVNTL